MKTIYKMIFALALLPLFVGCEPKELSETTFADDEMPKIYFESWAVNQTVEQGRELTRSPFVSPSDNVLYKWTLDGVVISTEQNLVYLVTDAPGDYTFRFDVERNGVVTYRTARLLITPAAAQ
jgi:hypothetical protein